MTIATKGRIVAILLGIFFFGVATGAIGLGIAKAEQDEIYAKLDIFAKVLGYVESNYVEDVDQQELIYGAIKGMLDTLDTHTVFMPPDIYREMKIDTMGEFEGLGVRVEMRDGQLTVIEPLVGSPAQKAGIEAGDIIFEIDGKATNGLGLKESTALLRGKIGTLVTLSIRRKGEDRPLSFKIIRSKIRSVSVSGRLLDSSIGHVRVHAFQDRTSAQMVTEIQKLKKKAGGLLNGLILDLRGNPGGLLDEAVRMVDEFISNGKIVTTSGRNGMQKEVESAHSTGIFQEGLMVVLIDKGSASASEIVAGALQDHGRALILGNQSYGKGSVQNIIDLDDGSGLKITVARYYTPDGRSIDHLGIEPDVVVTQPARLAELMKATDKDVKVLKNLEKTSPTGQLLIAQAMNVNHVSEDDHQLRAAFAYLKAKKLPQ